MRSGSSPRPGCRPGRAPAAAQDAAEAVVKKAIDAHGGADALNKYPAG